MSTPTDKPYDPLDSLEAEVARFMQTNTFTPMEVTGFYLQSRCVISELKLARKELEVLRTVSARQNATIRRIEADVVKVEEELTAMTKQRDDWKACATAIVAARPMGMECDDFHHSKKDLHECGQACRPLQRWDAALAAFEKLNGDSP
jgi:hypothetical protein